MQPPSPSRAPMRHAPSTSGRRPQRQHVLFLYLAGSAIGLHLALAQFALAGSIVGALFTMATTVLFCSVILALWIWVLPRVTDRPLLQRTGLQMLVALVTFTVLSFILTAVYGLFSGPPSLLVPYTGDGLTILVNPEQLRRLPFIFALIPIVPVAVLCVVSFNFYWVRLNALQDRERALRELATSAQLAALRAQLNPHFFFNSLNSIAQLIHTDPPKAEQCVERLGAIFRYMLGHSQSDFVALDDELTIAAAYLDIERARFGDNLLVTQEIDERARWIKVPGFVLQPLVENAVRHGISQKIGGGTVLIRATVDSEDLRLTVQDTGVGISHRSTMYERGVGLRNVRERLIKLFGTAHEPTITSTPGAGTTVTLRIPAHLDVVPEAA